MASEIFGSGLRMQPAVKRKIFVSYHHGGDQGYYDTFSRAFHDTYDVIAFASPYLWFDPPPSMRDRYGDLVYSMFDEGDLAKKQAIRACSAILKDEGRFALQIGSMSREPTIVSYAEAHGLCRSPRALR